MPAKKTEKKTSVKKKSSPSKKAESAKKGGVDFCFPEVCDISSVVEIYKDLSKLSGKKSVILDAKKVEKFTTPVAQVLLALSNDLKGSLTIKDPSEVFQGSLTDLGFIEQLNNWIGENG